MKMNEPIEIYRFIDLIINKYYSLCQTTLKSSATDYLVVEKFYLDYPLVAYQLADLTRFVEDEVVRLGLLHVDASSFLMNSFINAALCLHFMQIRNLFPRSFVNFRARQKLSTQSSSICGTSTGRACRRLFVIRPAVLFILLISQIFC